MIKNNKAVIAAALLVALSTTIIGVSAATEATPNDTKTSTEVSAVTKNTTDQEAKHAEKEAMRIKMDEAIKSGSFDTFKQVAAELPMGKKLLEKVTAENFTRFAEAHQYKKDGMELMKKSKTIMKELGFDDFKGHREGKMEKMMKWMKKGEKENYTENDPEGADDK